MASLGVWVRSCPYFVVRKFRDGKWEYLKAFFPDEEWTDEKSCAHFSKYDAERYETLLMVQHEGEDFQVVQRRENKVVQEWSE